MLNIHRIDHEASPHHCWRVTVQRRTRIYVRSFSDGRYGGAEQALVAATTYRDALIRSNPPLSKPVYCAILRRRIALAFQGLSVSTDRILQGAPRPSALLGRPMADRELSIPAQEVLHPEVWKMGRIDGPQGQGGRPQNDLVTDVFPHSRREALQTVQLHRSCGSRLRFSLRFVSGR